MTPSLPHTSERPNVVIIGGGTGGIAATRALRSAPVNVTVIDRRNYYLFQPLIYEVAGAIVNPEDITHAIRSLLRRQQNAHFRMGRVIAVDFDNRAIALDDGDAISYDYLILAIGLRADVERVSGAAENAFPLKSLDDAIGIRNHLVRRLETVSTHPELTSIGALDIVVVGGGTTGVEVVAAFSEIYNHALRDEFPEIDFTQTKITLLEAGDSLVPGFHPDLQRWVRRVLTKNGADIRLRSPVAHIGPESVTLIDGEQIPAGMVVLAAGVRATRLADEIGGDQTPDGRVLVEPNLSLPGHPEVFAIGDMAALPKPDGRLHPALAQFALQGGRHAAHEITRRLQATPTRQFHYWDKGMTSMVGYKAAILQSGRIRITGAPAFFLWGSLHRHYMPGFRNRLSLRLTWLWTMVTRRRAGLLLIHEPSRPAGPHAPNANSARSDATQPRGSTQPSTTGAIPARHPTGTVDDV